MMVRLLLVSAMMLVVTCTSAGQTGAGALAFGQAYGTAAFQSNAPSGPMTEAPNVVLSFTAGDGHRNLVLAEQTGDYIALLEPGRYCITAYTRAGEPIPLAPTQLKCITVERGKDVRLDVMLRPGNK